MHVEYKEEDPEDIKGKYSHKVYGYLLPPTSGEGLIEELDYMCSLFQLHPLSLFALRVSDERGSTSIGYAGRRIVLAFE